MSPFVDAESELGDSLLAWQEDERADPESGPASRLRVVHSRPDGSVEARAPAVAIDPSGNGRALWVARRRRKR